MLSIHCGKAGFLVPDPIRSDQFKLFFLEKKYLKEFKTPYLESWSDSCATLHTSDLRRSTGPILQIRQCQYLLHEWKQKRKEEIS